MTKSKHIIVGFSGYARSGKDYSGLELIATARRFDIHAKTYALASPIKLHCNAMFGWNERHSDGDLKETIDPFWGFSPRNAYQTFGTEWARNCLRDDIWLKFMERQHCLHKQEAIASGKNSIFVITDVRFPNEYKAIKNAGGTMVSVVNESTETDIMPHASEAFIKDIRNMADIKVENNYKINPAAAASSLANAIETILNG